MLTWFLNEVEGTCYILIVVVYNFILVCYHLHFVFNSEMLPKVVAVPEDDCCT